MGDTGASYYSLFHCCQHCGNVVYVEDKVAPAGSNPNNISRKDTVCNSCASRPMSDAEKKKLGL